MKVTSGLVVEHRVRSFQPALAGYGASGLAEMGVLAPGGSTCSSAGSSCSCTCAAVNATVSTV